MAAGGGEAFLEERMHVRQWESMPVTMTVCLGVTICGSAPIFTY